VYAANSFPQLMQRRANVGLSKLRSMEGGGLDGVDCAISGALGAACLHKLVLAVYCCDRDSAEFLLT
jgi:hypothetical protein